MLTGHNIGKIRYSLNLTADTFDLHNMPKIRYIEDLNSILFCSYSVDVVVGNDFQILKVQLFLEISIREKCLQKRL